MCNNCELHKAIEKLLNKYDMWTSHWVHEMSDEDLWRCEDEDNEKDESDEESGEESEDESDNE